MTFMKHFKDSFSLDYRSLAFYRFLMGLIVMAVVIYRLPDLTNFYTDVGLIPRGIFIGEMGMPWSLSVKGNVEHMIPVFTEKPGRKASKFIVGLEQKNFVMISSKDVGGGHARKT